MDRKKLVKLLLSAGYIPVRNNAHENFYNPPAQPDPNTGRPLKLIQVPNHREIGESLARKILKDAGLK